MAYCANCGAEVGPHDQYCPECNAAVDQGGHHQGGDTGHAGERQHQGHQRGQPNQHQQGQPRQGGQQVQGGHERGGAPGQPVQGGHERGGAPGRQVGGGYGNWDGTGYPRPPTRDDTDVVGSRIGAQIIDSVISFALFFGVLAAFGGLGAAAGGESGLGIVGLGILIAPLIIIFYFLLLEGFWDGYTVGKKVLGIKVVKEDGGECTIGSSLVRNLLRIIDGFFYYAVGFLLMAMSDKRQRLGDRVGGTVVVDDSP